MSDGRPPFEIGILLREQPMLGTVHGLTDLFGFADQLARERSGRITPMLRVRHFAQGPDGIVQVGDAAKDNNAELAIIIVPPRQAIALSMTPDEAASGWLRARHAAGVTVASTCGGVFLLAQAGLLNDRQVTTHWACADILTEAFPTVRVDADRLAIDDGDVITAGGMMAWANLGLIVVERLLGRAAMIDTARFMMIDPLGREQRFYRKFLPRRDHGDAAILSAQTMLEQQWAANVTVTEMAGWARLEVRTFVRRFLKATGFRPNEYCQRLRIEKAREKLEVTTEQVGTIAEEVGYTDPASFRKIFARITGLSPGKYRKRFGPIGVAAPRAVDAATAMAIG